jgi:hypothetical protein
MVLHILHYFGVCRRIIYIDIEYILITIFRRIHNIMNKILSLVLALTSPVMRRDEETFQITPKLYN